MLKRLFDLAFAIAGVIIFSPVLITIAFAVKLSSPGPAFYRGVRTGLHGRPFRIFKFRTMIVNAEHVGGPSTASNDPRLTKIGKFLRKYKLDELPQSFNIVKGDMSFVGPRPQVEKYTRLYTDEEKIILSVRPGLTDYASLKFINLDQILGDENVDEKYLKDIEPKKNKLRIQYVKEQTFWNDIKIIWLTILSMLKIRKIWNTGN